ncbi:hypothetical protein KIL84_015954 [Mauremys mutica]|uniref:Uncharacterized protein n=1 Tax=Mauremys mutica TaxID=74926 RepID=A0A9D4AME1_9SAUR|nr:hypothetical protein KIL84_015954 [Mauremys mutica]
MAASSEWHAFWWMRIRVTFISVTWRCRCCTSFLAHDLPFCHLAAQNAYRLGQMTSEVIADVHLIEQRYGRGEDIGLFSNKTYAKLSELDPKYKKVSSQVML